jgi:pseudaminic acid synthase
MIKDINIGNITIGDSHKPFIIAEMSGNHNQSIEKAIAIIESAAKCGVDAIKLQTYTPDSLTINHCGGLFDINDKSSLWSGRNLYELYGEAQTPYEWHERIFNCAKDLNVLCFSTPFDEAGVDFLEKLDAPAYKVASFENNHLPLLKKIASKGKPVIISSGASSLSDLAFSMNFLKENGNPDTVLLKCTSTYPASPGNSNVNTIPHMRKLFDCHVGLSDHTMGVGVPIAAVSLGAVVVEKHFCLSRAEGGVDSAFSLEPVEMKQLVVETKRAWEALGHVQYGVQPEEIKSLQYKRSIYCVANIEEGEIITDLHVDIIRPGDGLSPRYINLIIGARAQKAITRGTPFTWDCIIGK